MNLSLLEYRLYGNLLRDWTVAIGLAAVIALGFALLQRVLVRKLSERVRRTATRLDDALLEMLDTTRLSLVAVVAVSIGAQYLTLTHKPAQVIAAAATIALFLQIGFWAGGALEYWLSHSRTRALASNASAATGLSAMGFIARSVMWAVLVLLTLDNLGINITTLVAGLGIGGVAVALAVQSILGDVFASISILVDKPFLIGDFVVVDNYMGTVENVGLKTTRIRSADGELIVFSNGDLLKARLRNYKRMRERRVVLSLGMPLATPAAVLARLPEQLRGIIERQKPVRFERAHFLKISPGSLDFEAVYWVLDPDQLVYLNIQQAINLAVLRELAQARIPTLPFSVETQDEPAAGAAARVAAPPPAPPRGHA